MTEKGRVIGFPLALLFFLSGATALIYELVWFKRFTQVWGSSSLAMGAVVAAFLLGLGLGARYLGGRARRMKSPLRAYALCECGIAALAAFSLFEIELLRGPSSGLYDLLGGLGVLGAAVRLIVAFLVLGPATILMGATLPLLVSQLELSGSETWRSTAFLYATNTLGAAAGCFGAGFFLLPSFGLQGTLLIAVGINLVIAAGAFWLARQMPTRTGEQAAEQRETPALPRLAFAAFALGAGALAMHMIWARQLSLVLGGTTYSFTAMLFVVLLGIGIGSALLDFFGNRIRSFERVFMCVSMLLIVSTFAAQLGLSYWSYLAGTVLESRGSLTFNAWFCSSISAILELIPACCSGALLPLLVRFAKEIDPDAARSVGRLFAWNTLGAAVGATLTTVVLLPALGTAGGVVASVGLILVAVMVALSTRMRITPGLVSLAVLACVLAVPVARGRDPLKTGLGLSLYGTHVRESLSESEILFFEEGALAEVLVTRLGESVSMRVNGKVDASNLRADMVTQLGAAYLPRFLAPDARELLVVGYGSGCTVGASLLFPNTRVTCLEIEPAVVRAADHFSEVNHTPENSPGLRMVYDDARAFVEGTDERYDLIITEPSNPWMPGVSNLFTVEFYRAASERLTEGGRLAQWVQTYALSIDDYGSIVASLQSVFEQVYLVCLDGGDTLLLASHEPFDLKPATIDRLQRRIMGLPEVRADLLNYFGSEDVRELLLSHVLLADGISQLVPEGIELHTDSNMRLEFDSPLRLFGEAAKVRQGLITTFFDAARPQLFADLYREMGCRPSQVAGLHRWVDAARRCGRESLALAWIELGLELAPEDGALLADQLILDRPTDQEELENRYAALCVASADDAVRVAQHWKRSDELLLARPAYDRLIELHPKSATLLEQRAAVLTALGFSAEARLDLERAAELNKSLPRAPLVD